MFFKLRESAISTKWIIGKVEFVVLSKDKKVRKVGISYKQLNDKLEGDINVVERPARECVKLFNIEDTSLLDDIKAVRDAAEQILDEKQVVTKKEIDELFDDQNHRDEENPKLEDFKDEEDTVETIEDKLWLSCAKTQQNLG